MLRIALCDDKREFLKPFSEIVHGHCKEVFHKDMKCVVGPLFDSAPKVLEFLKTNHIDVLFLDIDMPGMSGFELAKIICKDYPKVLIVFVSAYDNFVYDAFEFSPFAYLRKNHLETELANVISRIQDRVTASSQTMYLMSKDGEAAVLVKDILYFESVKNYYKAYMVGGKTYECRGTITELEQDLGAFGFFRIHSAFLVNMEHVSCIEKNRSLVLSNDTALTVAPRRMQSFKDAYMEYTRRFFGV